MTFLITVTESLSEATYRRKDLFSLMVWRVQSIVARKEWKQEHLGLRWRDPGTADTKHRVQTWSEAMLQPSKSYTHTHMHTHAHAVIHLIYLVPKVSSLSSTEPQAGDQVLKCVPVKVFYIQTDSPPLHWSSVLAF